MAEAVRGNVVNVGALFDVFIDHSADAARCQTAASAMEKHRLILTFSGWTLSQESGTGFFEIMHQRLQGRLSEGNDALFFAFVRNADEAFAKIDVAKIQRYALAVADARCVKKLEYRPVAAAKVGIRIGRFDKPDGLFH